MAKTELAVAELIWNLIAGKTGNTSKVTYFPQKPAFPEESPEGEERLERMTPESQGISSAHLAAFLEALGAEKSTDIHQVLIARNGKVICECGYVPYPAGLWHASYSMCKSITGMAIGMLIEEGLLTLEARVVDLFRKRKNLLHLLRQKDITVRHLLTMTSCVNFNEAGSVTGNDWVRGFLESGLGGVPGKEFMYNSMNSYMLSAIVTELTGETLMEYLTPRLWEPLGIRRVFWESCPMGITKGGWGLFLRPEDAAKLGILYLNKGKWKTKQLVRAEWVEDSCREHVSTPSVMSSHGYGYQMWMGGREGAFNFNGMLGQNVVAYPDLNMVIVTNAGSQELFQNCVLMGIVKQYFETDYAPPGQLPLDPAAQRSLRNTIARLEGKAGRAVTIRSGGWGRKGKEVWKRGESWERKARGDMLLQSLDGCVYELEEAHVGLMPLMMQVFHNNYTDGIHAIGFMVKKDGLYVKFYEGEEVLCLPVGMPQDKGTKAADVDFHGEIYRIATTGAFAEDEDGKTVLKLDFAFLEDACRRKLKLYLDGDRIEARWDETPGKEVIMEGLDSITDAEGRMGFLMNAVREIGGIDVFHLLVERTIQPICRGKRKVQAAAAETEETAEREEIAESEEMAEAKEMTETKEAIETEGRAAETEGRAAEAEKTAETAAEAACMEGRVQT